MYLTPYLKEVLAEMREKKKWNITIGHNLFQAV